MNTRTSRLLPVSALTVLATTLVLIGCNRTPEPDVMPATPAAPSVSMGTQADDSAITAGVRAALLAEPDVRSFDLQVETRNGTVQLTGYVDNQAQIDRALAATRAVSGVTAVTNGVTLKGGDSTAGTKIDDSVVTTRVKTALLADPDIKSLDIGVLTFKGEVQLTGFVDSAGQIEQATRIARAADGATSVKNELKVKK